MTARIIRWLGALRQAADGRAASALAELVGIGRERAAEPLWRGKTALAAATVGLVAREADVLRFYERDCWSERADADTLRATKRRGGGRYVRDADRFFARYSRERPRHHAECWLGATATFVAVAWRPGHLDAAERVARATGLPLMERPILSIWGS